MNQHRLVIGIDGLIVYFTPRGGNATADYSTNYSKDQIKFMQEALYVGSVALSEKNRVLKKNEEYLEKNGL